MLPHPLDNFELQKYYQNKSEFNGFYSKNRKRKKEHGIYVINVD